MPFLMPPVTYVGVTVNHCFPGETTLP